MDKELVWTRTICPCRFAGRGERRLCIYISFSETGVLKMTGVGPNGSGQINDCLLDDNAVPMEGFTSHNLLTLYSFWSRWHLNDMRPGTPKQMIEVRKLYKQNPECSYDDVCEHLKNKGIYIDNGYRYGTRWLKEDVPELVIKWLFSLPGSGHTFEDIKSSFYNNFEISSDEFASLLGLGG